MSKKIFLKKSYAEAVKDIEGENLSESCLLELEEDYNPGRVDIRLEWMGFKYSKLHVPSDSSEESKEENPPIVLKTRNPRKRKVQKRRLEKLEEDVDEIIEILSSPEKSPFKVETSMPTKKAKRQIIISSDSESDNSLPSIESIPDKEENKTPEPVLEHQEFERHEGETHFDLYRSFTSVNRGLMAQEILEILTNPSKYEKCENIPQYIQKPAGFLLDLTKFSNVKDIRADGNGVWRNQSKPKRVYRLKEKVFQVSRSYSSHKETPNFRRLIIEVDNFPFIILQYYFIGNISPVTIKPHGNSKSGYAPPYRRLAPSALQKMSKIAKETMTSAKTVMDKFITDEGGIEHISPQNIPRNEQQIRNMKRKNEEKPDEIKKVLHEFDTQTDNFIRKIDIRPDFIVVLSSNQQLSDLKRFCTRQPCSILGIDPTFHFGDFDVTVTIYRNPMLEDTTSSNRMLNRCPVFVGPVCIHKKKDTQTYYTFFSTLIAKEKDLRNIKAIGSDGEVALSNASLMAFENAVHLRCFNHIKNNISKKLQDIGASQQSKKVLLSDIFGTISDLTTKMLGLVDCFTHIEFDQKLETLNEKWESLVLGFWPWFKKHLTVAYI